MKTTYIGLDGNIKEVDAFLKQPEWLKKIGQTYFEIAVEKKKKKVKKVIKAKVKEVVETPVAVVEEVVETVTETVEPAERSLEELCDAYEEKYNKRPVGKWAKDMTRLISKL